MTAGPCMAHAYEGTAHAVCVAVCAWLGAVAALSNRRSDEPPRWGEVTRWTANAEPPQVAIQEDLHDGHGRGITACPRLAPGSGVCG
jgi:hypothetical protein